jgi:peptide methionine sulfoxide reductase MsrB
LFWSVNDSTAIGVIQAIEQAGFKSGKDFFVSGCGWDPSIFPLISQGKVTSSVGGHFMDGAWALVMLHDYHHGIDFIDEKWTSNMYELNQINGQSLSQLINKENWSKIDFKQFSKHYTPLIDKYNFRLNSVLEKTLTAE